MLGACLYLGRCILHSNVYKMFALCGCRHGPCKVKSKLSNVLSLLTGLMGNVRIQVFLSLPPGGIRSPQHYTLYSYSSKTALHPASQNILVEMREACDNPGTICATAMLPSTYPCYVHNPNTCRVYEQVFWQLYCMQLVAPLLSH